MLAAQRVALGLAGGRASGVALGGVAVCFGACHVDAASLLAVGQRRGGPRVAREGAAGLGGTSAMRTVRVVAAGECGECGRRPAV
ncbi:hypothetical protein Aglo01_65850 [Actinokineospora globicatena]|nr:hypothetical protein Aglo01_65850 [Actinokineospora globicatena]GLW88897.1 hypothetical protein Aglo02_65360 [Actinokineospora globicatena]